MYTTIHHTYPTLLGTTNLALRNLRFGIDNMTGRSVIDVCEICAIKLQFFDEQLPSAMYGKIGECYADIIEYSRNKILLYVGHSMRCVVHRQSIDTLLKNWEVIILLL